MDTPGVTGAVSAPGDDAYADWRRALAGVVARDRRVAVEDLGPAPEGALVSRTEDGAPVQALYTGRDERPEWPPPGVAPYVRGSRPPGNPWRICAPVDDLSPQRVRAALDAGARALWVTRDRLEPGGPVLDVPVVLTPPPVAAELDDLLAGLADRPDSDVCLGIEVLGPLLRGEAVPGIALAGRTAPLPGSVRALVVDATLVHEAGATAADEIGVAVAAGVAAARSLVESGMDPRTALAQLDFRFAVTDEQFESIAKLRAARLCWARVAEVVAGDGAGPMRQHAVTSAAMCSRLDPWVNLLRGTVAAFAAGIGGAELVTVRPFDEPLPGGLPGVPPQTPRRLAVTTQLLLLQEAHLGHVSDPAGGSWYVEALTDELAGRAWARVQQLEAQGGIAAAGATVQEWVQDGRRRRDVEVAHRRRALTGVNAFPDLTEPPRFPATDVDTPFAEHRYGAAFEALRARSDAHLLRTGSRPVVLLVPLGPATEHTARLTFAVNLLASGGITAATDAGTQSPVAVVVGADGAYATDGSGAVARLHATGRNRVLAAGRAAAFPDGGPDGYLGQGIDAAAALGDLLDALGVA